MNRSMIVASNTMNQLQKQLDIISNNLANIDTNGFKKREATFTDLLAQSFNNQPNKNEEIGRLTPNEIRVGVGAKLAQSQMVTKQGSLKQTGRPLDIAFTNESQYMKVLVDNNGEGNIRYTRDGALYLSPINQNEMLLVNSEGYPVLDENNQMISISGNSSQYTFSSDGRFEVTLTNGQKQEFNLGIVSVKKPQFLEQMGENLLGVPANAGATVNDILTELVGPLRNQVSIQQGSLEGSNVNLSKEMTDLINVQRSYQFQSKAISLSDQMMGLVNGIR
ncbi:flagellar biosynthesis protein FlgG [Bacillus obstructivus]|uniref:Flagellar hook-basal body protein n=1 Tax=Heyndrickxia oleronia TaxID=38875 RepID=A0AAW6T1R8_9BACI|nr:flagellar hook-basal body protein [Heyndrickxia oleronia]MBU5214619.1 flagellar hook-basal body protein [Heyndrickxia oleronia]MCM3239896.1 flagellar hook-basal body protein [Heyndrickxia oleronia]MDH5162796.1 flagellar hook-basal body protein [Heyndrickxia oleronia]OJH16539.1 flagellar biosynthesis protein FlgG [Bacillus obstructivus]